jgi:hypothetical protein
VIEEAEGNEPTAEVQVPPGQDGPKENGKHAEVYRLPSRPRRTPNPD